MATVGGATVVRYVSAASNNPVRGCIWSKVPLYADSGRLVYQMGIHCTSCFRYCNFARLSKPASCYNCGMCVGCPTGKEVPLDARLLQPTAEEETAMEETPARKAHHDQRVALYVPVLTAHQETYARRHGQLPPNKNVEELLCSWGCFWPKVPLVQGRKYGPSINVVCEGCGEVVRYTEMGPLRACEYCRRCSGCSGPWCTRHNLCAYSCMLINVPGGPAGCPHDRVFQDTCSYA